MRTSVELHHGAPALFIDGAPVTGLMHWNRVPTPEDTALFRDAGVRFFSFMGNLCVTPPGPVPAKELEVRDGGLPRMLLTPENIDRTMEMLTGVDPGIKILPRIILNPPVWWEKLHPEELMLYHHLETGETIRGPRASLHSEAWRNDWLPALRDTVAYFEKRWGDFIFGYHTGLGHCGEHTYQWWDHVADFNPLALGPYRNWLGNRYGSIERLNRAWRSGWKSFGDISLPEPARFAGAGPRTPALFLPETETELVDFQAFASDAMADALLLEASAVKATLHELGAVKVFGAFYGYINLVGNSTQAATGHGSLTRVLDSPDVDFLCGPLSYGARQAGGAALPQMVPGSIRLRGKLFYNEDDTGTHVVPCPHHGYTPVAAADSLAVERRNFLETWRSGGTQWWMDLYGAGWFLDEALRGEFARLVRFAEENFTDRRSRAEIAVFVSLESSFHMRDNPVPLTGSLIEHQLFEIAACGASFDLFQEDDLPLLARKGELEKYKLCVFLNTLAPTEEVRETVELLKGNNRTLLWFYAPGYLKGNERSAAFAEELTGVRFHAVEGGIMPMLTETRIGRHRITYGISRAVYPRLTADDPDAEILGYYVNGTTIAGARGPGAALVKKEFGSWRSVWSSSPGLPSTILAGLAKEAGVHVFSERGDQVFYAGNWLGVHCRFDGPLELALPGVFACRDAITGELHPPAARLRLEVKRGETRLFILRSAH